MWTNTSPISKPLHGHREQNQQSKPERLLKELPLQPSSPTHMSANWFSSVIPKICVLQTNAESLISYDAFSHNNLLLHCAATILIFSSILTLASSALLRKSCLSSWKPLKPMVDLKKNAYTRRMEKMEISVKTDFRALKQALILSCKDIRGSCRRHSLLLTASWPFHMWEAMNKI